MHANSCLSFGRLYAFYVLGEIQVQQLQDRHFSEKKAPAAWTKLRTPDLAFPRGKKRLRHAPKGAHNFEIISKTGTIIYKFNIVQHKSI